MANLPCRFRLGSRAGPVDWAQFVATALAAAAANVGGTDAALRGRPGSWEADAVRQLVEGTLGENIASGGEPSPIGTPMTELGGRDSFLYTSGSLA